AWNGSASFAYYAPKMFQYYVNTLGQLYERHPHLVPPGGARADGMGVFSARCPNLDKKSVAYLHNDHANLAFGWCAIQSLGNFDPKKGGHLILQQLGVVVEFPPGATVLIPSAIVTHGNTPIQEHERRSSLVHYSSGGLFRWVEYGFRTWNDFKAADPIRAAQVWEERTTKRVDFALSLFSKASELAQDHRKVFYK
ncbi:hypothetical protein PHLGIDRAFT_70801, partial [Phlebiopsis gigantea 11061_1 CR5-6]